MAAWAVIRLAQDYMIVFFVWQLFQLFLDFLLQFYEFFYAFLIV